MHIDTSVKKHTLCDQHTEVKSICAILETLLNSSALDLVTEAKDCLTVFSEYDWVMAAGADEALFNMLKSKGDNGNLSLRELDEFIGLVSKDSEKHLYLTLLEGRRLLDQIRCPA